MTVNVIGVLNVIMITDFIFQRELKETRHVALVSKENFYKLYDIKVQAVNDIGRGNMSEIVRIYSAEDSKYSAIYHPIF